MDTYTILTLGLLAVVCALLIWLVVQLRKLRATGDAERLRTTVELMGAELMGRQSESLLSLRDSLDNANKVLNDRLAEGTSSLDRRMTVLGEIENRLGQLATQTEHIEAVGKNIQSLSELLRPPNLRGSVGEQLLENLLAQILPRSMYHIQYGFTNGVRVDAAIALADRLLPVDAKFPLDAFERLRVNPDDSSLQKEFSRAFKIHVDAIADKYIQPQEKTTDFAVMYIPAEAVYYQLIAQDNQDGFDYALSRRVIPSSPGHLYAFLASVATLYAELSLAGAGLTDQSRQLIAGLNKLVETTDRLARFHEKMDGSLRGLGAGFDRAKRELSEARLQLEKLREPFTGNVDDAAAEEAELKPAKTEET